MGVPVTAIVFGLVELVNAINTTASNEQVQTLLKDAGDMVKKLKSSTSEVNKKSTEVNSLVEQVSEGLEVMQVTGDTTNVQFVINDLKELSKFIQENPETTVNITYQPGPNAVTF